MSGAVPEPTRTAPATYAVLGDPVAHSLSPAMHGAAFRAAGRRARYVARRVSAADCGELLRSLALGGGGGNVTVPHKERVVPFLDRRTPAVDATGACNTFWAEDGQVWGDNTDVEGFRGAWKAMGARGPTVLVLGAGGAARAVVLALRDAPAVERVLVWNRTRARAEAMAGHLSGEQRAPQNPAEPVRSGGAPAAARPMTSRRNPRGPTVAVVGSCAGLAPDAVVNATSAGLDGRSSPLDLGTLGQAPRALMDLVYGARPTPLCRQARRLDVPWRDGRDMLVRQAEAAYRRWFGEPPPPGVMAAALGSTGPEPDA